MTKKIKILTLIPLLLLLSACNYRYYSVQNCSAEKEKTSSGSFSKICFSTFFCPGKVYKNGRIYYKYSERPYTPLAPEGAGMHFEKEIYTFDKRSDKPPCFGE